MILSSQGGSRAQVRKGAKRRSQLPRSEGIDDPARGDVRLFHV
jgi:hypothetical protein